MPLTTLHPLSDVLVQAFNPTAGSQTGSRIGAVSPVRGQVIEAGFMPNSLIGSTMTLAVAIGVSAASITASAAYTQIVTSTLGTFNSTLTNEGNVCSVVPPSPSYCNPGDVIQWTTSGGNTSAVGANVYAIIRRG